MVFFSFSPTMGGQISISENVTQNKIVYPNISKITGAFLIPQLTFTDVSWSYKTDDGDDDDDGFRNGDNYGNNVYNYENIVKASYLIPEQAVNIKLSLKATYNDVSRNFDNSQSVIPKIPEISGNLDISNIDNIKDNIINAKSNIQIPGTIKKDIKWTIKGTDVSHSFTSTHNNIFTFTNDNVKRWKEIIENINKYDKKHSRMMFHKLNYHLLRAIMIIINSNIFKKCTPRNSLSCLAVFVKDTQFHHVL